MSLFHCFTFTKVHLDANTSKEQTAGGKKKKKSAAEGEMCANHRGEEDGTEISLG